MPAKKLRLLDNAVPTLFLTASDSSVLSGRSDRQNTLTKKRQISEGLQDLDEQEKQAIKEKFRGTKKSKLDFGIGDVRFTIIIFRLTGKVESAHLLSF